MKSRKFKLITATIIGLAALYINVSYINPNILKVRQEIIKTSKMPKDHDLTLAYFSDIQYGKNHTNQAFDQLAETINQFDPDIVVFGGDVFDFSEDNGFDGAAQETITNELSQIECSLGKYAVLGDQDHTNQESIRTILNNAEFEVITNSLTTIYADHTPLVNLVAIEPIMYNNISVDALYETCNQDIYTISICHTPDIFDNLSQGDLLLSGHTLNGQLYLPLISNLIEIEGGNKYYRHQAQKENLTLDITSGVGCKGLDLRLLADPEVVIYQIRNDQ